MNINKQKLKKFAWSVFKYTAVAIGALALLAVMQIVVLVLMIEGYL
jgi:type IV secretory pathway component VirB8